MTHLQLQKLISSTQVRGYNMQFLLYPQPHYIYIYICSFSTIFYAISINDTCLKKPEIYFHTKF